MKKIYILISILMLTTVFVSCTSIFSTLPKETTTTAAVTSNNTITITWPTSRAITTATIDKDMLISDVYDMIYADLYNEVKSEVLSNMSEDQFNQIYAQALQELLKKVDDGSITITPASIVDMIKNVSLTAASAVIGVSTYDDTGELIKIGSGVIYKSENNKYFVVTNDHVVDGGTSYKIEFADGTTATAILKGVDNLVDLAVLYFLSDNDYTVAEFGDSSLVSQGDIVLAVGNPKGYEFYGSITMGIVSGLDRYFDIDGDGVRDMFVNYIQHDAAINSGNSGGALFDIYGKVIGINVIKFSATEIEGLGFAIPSNLVSAICSDIEIYGHSLQVPVLGIEFHQLRGNIDYLKSLGVIIPDNIVDGFYITNVIEGASFYGYVEAGDILVKIDDIDLTIGTDFKYYFSKYLVGDTVSISLYRDGVFMTFDNIELKAKAVD